MSSYKVDPRTNRPILYLLDQKESLWKRFSEIYPNGMKRTAFMGRIEDGPYRYREDLGGLCSICAEYGYEVFDDLAKIIRLHIENLSVQVCNLHNFHTLFINYFLHFFFFFFRINYYKM
jgi:hypothetical protein